MLSSRARSVFPCLFAVRTISQPGRTRFRSPRLRNVPTILPRAFPWFPGSGLSPIPSTTHDFCLAALMTVKSAGGMKAPVRCAQDFKCAAT